MIQKSCGLNPSPLRCILFCQEHFRILIHYNECSVILILVLFVIKCVNVLSSRTSEVELHIAPAREECMTHSINNSTKTIYRTATVAFPSGLYKTHELDNTFFLGLSSYCAWTRWYFLMWELHTCWCVSDGVVDEYDCLCSCKLHLAGRGTRNWAKNPHCHPQDLYLYSNFTAEVHLDGFCTLYKTHSYQFFTLLVIVETSQSKFPQCIVHCVEKKPNLLSQCGTNTLAQHAKSLSIRPSTHQHCTEY